MPRSANQSLSLNILLLKEDILGADDAVNRGEVGREHAMRAFGDQAQLFTRQVTERPPRWKRLVESLAQPPLGALTGSSAAGLLLVPCAKRLFALTFGHGRTMLRRSTWEENFGLRVTLNSVEPTKLRSVDVKMLDPLARHSRISASQDGDLAAFGFNPGQDLLRAVTGKPNDEALGNRMTGMDALTVSVRAAFDELPALLARYLEQYNRSDYRQRFPQVDNIREVRDRSIVEKLDEEMVRAIANGNRDKLWLAVPGPVDWQRVGAFRYHERGGEPVVDIHWDSFLRTVRGGTSSLARLKARRVYALDHDGEPLPELSWRVYDCVYCETKQSGSTYLLTEGKWYRLGESYVKTVDRDVRSLVATSSTLPPYNDKNEGAYNLRVSRDKAAGLVLMDKVNIPHGGRRSKIEFCDLFSKQGGRMFHVKRYEGGSSAMSHLFMQGVVSANAFLGDATFREKVEKKLKSAVSWKVGQPPNPAQHEVVFAIVSGSKKSLVESLPFFTKVAMTTAASHLRSMQLPVVVEKIDR